MAAFDMDFCQRGSPGAHDLSIISPVDAQNRKRKPGVRQAYFVMSTSAGVMSSSAVFYVMSTSVGVMSSSASSDTRAENPSSLV